MIVRFRKVHEAAQIPRRMTASAAGLDLFAYVPEGACAVIYPGERWSVGTGVEVEIPAGYEGQVRPRSGLALHEGVTVLNSPGTIDADYRGEIRVLLVNLGTGKVVVENGDRIAQLVIAPIVMAEPLEVAELTPTIRGGDGFGSTDVRKDDSAVREVAENACRHYWCHTSQKDVYHCSWCGAYSSLQSASEHDPDGFGGTGR